MQNKYFTIYHDIANQIQNGIIKPNRKLPSENELVEQYGVSRETIRKALNLLSQNGYIQKIQGKGSLVLDMSKFNFPISGLVSFRELANKMGKQSNTVVHVLELITPDDYLMDQLNTSDEEQVWKVIRSREIEGEKIILDKDFLSKKFVPELTQAICEHSIYDYLENRLGLTISFAKKEISVEDTTDEDRKYLDVEGYQSMVVVKNYVYLDDATLFQYTESRHRPDKFRFVDFARRNHKP
ncbi:trehalose operon repressor [Aneurinibacillus terranovensis]|uniref:trehalose operon repressor n=1 Tax=Aneurinibacillus terranovensis TaxID=278991 RepID=UPI0004060BD9|nr:trehalose operon repressor [Aneurinibacillus terranovensis]